MRSWSLGSRLSEPTTAGFRVPGMDQRWMHVDLEPRSGPVGFASAPELAIRADARAFLRAANTRLKEGVLLARPVAARDRNNAADRAAWEEATVVDGGDWSGPGVHPGRIIADLHRLLPEDAIVTTDAGHSRAGWPAGSGSDGPAPSSDLPRGRWATASRRRSRRRSCTVSGASSRSSVMVAWA